MKNNKLAIITGIMILVSGCDQWETKNTNDDNTRRTIDMAHCCIESDVFMWDVAQTIKSKLEQSTEVDSVNLVSADGDQNKQYNQIKDMIAKGDKVIVSSLVIDDTVKKPFQKKLMQEAKEHNTQLIFYTIAPKQSLLKEFDNVYFVGSVPEEAGILQGEMIVKDWIAHPEWDKNHDGVIQYALLRGPAGNPDAEARTKWVQATIKNYPMNNIKAELVDLKYGLHLRDKAREITKDWYLGTDAIGEKIELIIAGNDDMALGALDTLKPLNIKVPIYGVDAVPNVVKAIKAGDIQGSVKQDGATQAETIKTLAVNLLQGNEVNKNIPYQIIDHRIDIPLVKVDRSNASNF